METKENRIDINQEKVQEVVDFIRKNSARGKLIKNSDLLIEPISLTNDNINIIIELIKSSTEYSDIVELKGKQQAYLYSNREMTEIYSKMIFGIEENDFISLVVETVRRDSKIYPRPTAINTFRNPPFNFNETMLNSILKQILENEDYKDIQKTKASNNAIYLYSTNHLTEDHAHALTEWIEVERFENP